MAIIVREPRNPLADALGVLSSQILADAAARRERAFRSQEIAAERAYQAGENALQREFLKGQNEELLSARAMEYASGLAQARELARIGAERDIALSDRELEGRKAEAGAIASGNAANLKLVEAQIEAGKRAQRVQDEMLNFFGLPGGGGSPSNALKAEALFNFDENARVEIPKAFRDAYDLIDPEGSDTLPLVATSEEIKAFAQKARDKSEWFAWRSPWDALGGVNPNTVADGLERLAKTVDDQKKKNSARLAMFNAGLGVMQGTPMVATPTQ